MEMYLIAIGIFVLDVTAILFAVWTHGYIRSTTIPKKYKTPLKPIFKPKKQEETEEERKYNAIIDNIDNYDGTGKNQKEVR